MARADSAVTWGSNAFGDLGDGTELPSSTAVFVTGLVGDVTAVAAGQNHSLAVINGSVYGWGWNDYGQVGDGTVTVRHTPALVVGLSGGVVSVAAGSLHSLAVKDSAAYAWGDNQFGELGDGTTTQRNSPVAVTGLSSGVTAVAGGSDFSLAIQNGGAYAWGVDTFGQLGIGSFFSNRSTPVAVRGLASGVTAIAAGESFSLALQNGAVYAWGNNNRGQLGIGTTSSHSLPVAVSGLTSGVTAIAAGSSHSLAVQNGGVYAWGTNIEGELGDGSFASISNVPERIDPVDLTSIVAVAAGAFDSYALSSDGSLWVWGRNDGGELGLGTNTFEYLTPQHLLPPAGYVFSSIDSNSDSFHVVATLSTVPEPPSLILAASAGMGCAVFVLRRRKWLV